MEFQESDQSELWQLPASVDQSWVEELTKQSTEIIAKFDHKKQEIEDAAQTNSPMI